MGTVWIRHPRYSLFILVSLITTCYLLFVHEALHCLHVTSKGPNQPFHMHDDSLESRVQRAHTIYNKFLVQRKGFLDKWGPTSKEIVPYAASFFFFAFMKALLI